MITGFVIGGLLFATSLCGVVSLPLRRLPLLRPLLLFANRHLSHTISHTPSLTHIFVNHHLSHTISHTPSLTHLCQPPSSTQHLSHTIFHTPSFTHFVNHHLSYTISHTPFLTHIFVNHHLSHTISHTPSLTHLCQPPSSAQHLSHTIFYTPSFTHFVNHHLSHTIIFVNLHLSHTIFRTPSFAHHLCVSTCGSRCKTVAVLLPVAFLFLCVLLGFVLGTTFKCCIHIYMRSTLHAEKYVGFKYPYLSGRRNLDSSHVWYVGKAPGLFRRVAASRCI